MFHVVSAAFLLPLRGSARRGLCQHHIITSPVLALRWRRNWLINGRLCGWKCFSKSIILLWACSLRVSEDLNFWLGRNRCLPIHVRFKLVYFAKFNSSGTLASAALRVAPFDNLYFNKFKFSATAPQCQLKCLIREKVRGWVVTSDSINKPRRFLEMP